MRDGPMAMAWGWLFQGSSRRSAFSARIAMRLSTALTTDAEDLPAARLAYSTAWSRTA